MAVAASSPPRTTELYEDLLKRHIAATKGKKSIGKITPAMVRSWYTALGKELALRAAQPRVDGGRRVATGQTHQRQAYALLKGVMRTATHDGLRPEHTTMGAAMKYQHADDERGKVVASRMSDAMTAAMQQGTKQA